MGRFSRSQASYPPWHPVISQNFASRSRYCHESVLISLGFINTHGAESKLIVVFIETFFVKNATTTVCFFKRKDKQKGNVLVYTKYQPSIQNKGLMQP